MEKIALLTPIPSAKQRIAAVASTGERRSCLRAKVMSAMTLDDRSIAFSSVSQWLPRPRMLKNQHSRVIFQHRGAFVKSRPLPGQRRAQLPVCATRESVRIGMSARGAPEHDDTVLSGGIVHHLG